MQWSRLLTGLDMQQPHSGQYSDTTPVLHLIHN